MSANIIIDYWMEKARDDLASALENGSAGRFQVAVRDAYFCCFHAFSALLLKENRTFRSHKEVRSSLHRDYVFNGYLKKRSNIDLSPNFPKSPYQHSPSPKQKKPLHRHYTGTSGPF